jgi:cytidylate kinase
MQGREGTHQPDRELQVVRGEGDLMSPTTQPRGTSVDELVERQVKRWMSEQQSQSQHVEGAQARPVVTISREAGSSGTALGRLVAEELGFRLWDQELVQRMAEQTGASELPFAAVDERARGAVEDLLAGILMGDAGTETEYLARLLRVIHAIARGGSAVIVGRGAQFVLDPARALRVRVVAPIDSRSRQLADARKISEAEARAEVGRIDRERLGFIRHHFHRNAADPSAYDLLLNTAALPTTKALNVVVAAYRAKFSPEVAQTP